MSEDIRDRRNRNKREKVKPRKSKRWLLLLLLLIGGCGAGGYYADKAGLLDGVELSSLFNSSKVEESDDIDNDGIPNSEDKCPNESGLIRCNGCPDTDKDGICNQEDKCPNEFSRTNNGCPKKEKDTDDDGVLDTVDDCIRIKGVPYCNGCPDTDGDGVCDRNDKCPSVHGTGADGCLVGTGTPPPPKDTDGDGFPDNNDNCPTQFSNTNNGCPPPPKDTDGDGFPDNNDNCPTQFSQTNNGCLGGPPPHQCMMDHIDQAEKDVKKADGSSSKTNKGVETALLSAKTHYNQSLSCSYIIAGGRDKVQRGLRTVTVKLSKYHEAKGDNFYKLGEKGFAKDEYKKAQKYIDNDIIQEKIKRCI
jgi:hypothetical protein